MRPMATTRRKHRRSPSWTHGDYRVDEVISTMPGLWELRLEAETDAEYDEVAFLFEVP